MFSLVIYFIYSISSIQYSCSFVLDSLQSPGLQHARSPVHHQLPELAQTHVHRVSDAIRPSHPLSSLSPFAFNLSQHQGLCQWVSSLHQVAKVLELQLQDWFPLRLTDLLAVKGTLKSLVQHHSLKASVLRCSAFLIVLLSHPYMITEKP